MNALSTSFCNDSKGEYNITFHFEESSMMFLRTYSYSFEEHTAVGRVSVQKMLDEIPYLVIQELYLELEEAQTARMLEITDMP